VEAVGVEAFCTRKRKRERRMRQELNRMMTNSGTAKVVGGNLTGDAAGWRRRY
jgi:hypothetical protein